MTELFLLDDEGKLKAYIFKLIIADYRRHEIIVRLIVGMRDNLVGVYYNMYGAVVLIVTDVLYAVQPPRPLLRRAPEHRQNVLSAYSLLTTWYA